MMNKISDCKFRLSPVIFLSYLGICIFDTDLLTFRYVITLAII